MKKIMNKLTWSIMSMLLLVGDVVLADPLGTEDIDGTLSEVMNVVISFAKPIGALLIFVGVVMVGFNIIRHRDNAEERQKSMESLLWLAIGAFIIGSAMTIAGFLWGASEKIDSTSLRAGVDYIDNNDNGRYDEDVDYLVED